MAAEHFFNDSQDLRITVDIIPPNENVFYAYTEGRFGQFTLIVLIFSGKFSIAYIFPNYPLRHKREISQFHVTTRQYSNLVLHKTEVYNCSSYIYCNNKVKCIHVITHRVLNGNIIMTTSGISIN
jgi:hypothetical protein